VDLSEGGVVAMATGRSRGAWPTTVAAAARRR
jgi:hypothetical protein